MRIIFTWWISSQQLRVWTHWPSDTIGLGGALQKACAAPGDVGRCKRWIRKICVKHQLRSNPRFHWIYLVIHVLPGFLEVSNTSKCQSLDFVYWVIRARVTISPMVMNDADINSKHRFLNFGSVHESFGHLSAAIAIGFQQGQDVNQFPSSNRGVHRHKMLAGSSWLCILA